MGHVAALVVLVLVVEAFDEKLCDMTLFVDDHWVFG